MGKKVLPHPCLSLKTSRAGKRIPGGGHFSPRRTGDFAYNEERESLFFIIIGWGMARELVLTYGCCNVIHIFT